MVPIPCLNGPCLLGSLIRRGILQKGQSKKESSIVLCKGGIVQKQLHMVGDHITIRFKSYSYDH